LKAQKFEIKETPIKHQIRDYLKIQGFFQFWNMQGMACYPGLPDRVAVKEDYIFYIEVKRQSGDLNKNQKKFKIDFEPHTGKHVRYILARSLEDVASVVRECGLEDHPALW
jgi:hypothetical protein